MSKEIKKANRAIGSEHPACIIAEAGSNHNQDFEMAKTLIKSAAEVGADAIKFQALQAKEHFSKHTPI